MPQSPATPAPLALRVVAGFLFLATALSLVIGTILLVPGTALDQIWQWNPAVAAAFTPHAGAAAGMLLLLGVATCAAALGLLRRRVWALWVAIAIFLLNGLGDLVALLFQHDLVRSGSGVLIAAIFLTLLLSRRSRTYFYPNRVP